jgi:hypothetical protein
MKNGLGLLGRAAARPCEERLRKEMLGQRRFAHLPGAGHKGYFSLFRKEPIDF